MVLAFMNSEGANNPGEGDKLVRDVGTKFGGAPRRFYLWVLSELKPFPSCVAASKVTTSNSSLPFHW